jgi:hypothetical protein
MNLDYTKTVIDGIIGIADSFGDAIDKVFTSDEERLKAKNELEKIQAQARLDAYQLTEELNLKFTNELNKRIAEMEGTASDLLALPFIGRIMLFLRGSQRPTWGFGVLYFDFMIFSEQWQLAEGTQESAFWIINFLVLGFLFGERAMKNVLPLVTQFLSTRAIVESN